ncbi:hypothetical protein Tco_1506518 [Tanacetum coccineum]
MVNRYEEETHRCQEMKLAEINALHLSSGKQITALNEEISNLNKQLSKEKSTVSSLLEEKKKFGPPFGRDVRTLAIEEAYTTKYYIHPRADFRLSNRWLSVKKDIASCGSKYLAYSEEEVEYQGSSGLLLQPELPE